MKRIAWSGIGIALLLGMFSHATGAQNDASHNQASQNQASSNQASSNSQGSSAGDSSLGDYARQVRKAPVQAKQKVFDNDNLPREEKLSIVGNAPEAPAASTETKPEEAAAGGTAATGTSTTGTSTATTTPTAPSTGEGKAQSSTEAATAACQDKTAAAASAKSPEEEEAAKQAAWKQWGDRIAAQKDQISLMERELDVLQREYKLRAAAMYADVGNRMRNAADWDKQDAQYKQQIADKQAALDAAKQKLDDVVEDARKAGVPASIREP